MLTSICSKGLHAPSRLNSETDLNANKATMARASVGLLTSDKFSPSIHLGFARSPVDWLRGLPSGKVPARRASSGLSIRADGSSPVGKTVVEFESPKRVWDCDWFPMRAEEEPHGGPRNLYGRGGALEAYDLIFKPVTSSREWEEQNYGLPMNSNDRDAGWAGHCDMAAIVTCLLEEPVKAVTLNGVTVSPDQIKGLLVTVADNIIQPPVEKVGVRDNDIPDEDPDDVRPLLLLNTLKAWAQDKRPFIMDIDRLGPVWNYPYNKVKVTEFAKIPENAQALPGESLPPVENTKYYRFEISRRENSAEDRQYLGWIHSPSGGTPSSSWLMDSAVIAEGGPEFANPDFIWRPEYNPNGWQGASTYNPHVDMANVRALYERSIS